MLPSVFMFSFGDASRHAFFARLSSATTDLLPAEQLNWCGRQILTMPA
jgi:hypothetical protein